MMKRGDIYFATLDPAIGSETRKKRPVLIISNNANNKTASTVTVLPITSNTNKIYPFEVLLEIKEGGLAKRSKIQCHQIRTISRIRIEGKRAGFASQDVMVRIDDLVTVSLPGAYGKPRPALIIQSDLFDEHPSVTILPFAIITLCFISVFKNNQSEKISCFLFMI